MYKEVDPKENFSKMEEQILKFWKEKDIFKKSLDKNDGKEEFVFYDGPPFATGLPHFGNFVPSVLKDVIPRYKTMKGYRVERRFGWDCHGLPVENEIEKKLSISGRKKIEEFGVEKFNEECRSVVLRYTKEWETIISRLGRWVDFKNAYKTMDKDYMESIWWIFKSLWDKGYLYQGHYILPYSPALATPLSNFEVNLGGYKEVNDPAITVRFELEEDDLGRAVKDTFILAWTTTPWTLPSNLALCVNANIDYVKLQDLSDSKNYILSKSTISKYYKDENSYKILEEFKGNKLFNYKYKPLLNYFADLKKDGAFKVLKDDYVTDLDGTGIVHIAPAFGEDDYRVFTHFLKDVKIVCPIDDDCFFEEEVSDFKGMFVKDADNSIIKKLKEEGKLVKRENYLHNYPFCYRTGKPLIYKAVSSWFVKVTSIKNKMLDANSNISWNPKHIKEGRFGRWLQDSRDWAISRNRYWGNPIPVWIEDNDSGYMECISSIEELEKKSGLKLTDIHKHIVDKITWKGPNGGVMRRTPEVLDCWFESGSMPYAQEHYPFENKERFLKNFPADFIAEGLDQTRGWFYTLTVISSALFEKPAFKNAIVNGLVLAEDGKKMSKSAKNYTDPNLVMEQFGADSLRMFLVNSSIVQAKNLKYSDDGVKEILKKTILPLWSAYSFFVTYANIDGIKVSAKSSSNFLDKWIISMMEGFSKKVEEELEKYNVQGAIDLIFDILENLNNFYIRRSRRRFWKSENDEDKMDAYNTLYKVLFKFVKIISPFMPFTAEEIYLNLKEKNDPESVHLCDFPKYDESLRSYEIEEKVEAVQKAIRLGRAIRSMHNLRNRQPLSSIHLITRDSNEINMLKEMEDIIKDELNVKEVFFRENEEELVSYKSKANFKILGKELGTDMKEANSLIEKLNKSQISSLLNGSYLELELANGKKFKVNQDRVVIQREERENLKVLNEGTLTIAIDTVITKDLKQEGMVRDLVRNVQNLRKALGFKVSDRIQIHLKPGNLLAESILKFKKYFKEETLCKNLNFEDGYFETKKERDDRREIVDLLIEGGADVHAKNIDGATPLHMAFKHFDFIKVKSLIKAGANLNEKDKKGRTPRYYGLKCFPGFFNEDNDANQILESLEKLEQNAKFDGGLKLYLEEHAVLINDEKYNIHIEKN